MASTFSPALGRSRITGRSNGRTVTITNGKARAKPNGSILNFFGKAKTSQAAEDSIEEFQQSLFLEEESPVRRSDGPIQTPTPPCDYSSVGNSPNYHSDLSSTNGCPSCYHEEDGPSKRRRLEDSSDSSPLATKRAVGPFVEVSDDEEEIVNVLSNSTPGAFHSSTSRQAQISGLDLRLAGRGGATDVANSLPVLSFRQDSMSIAENEFEGTDDFIDDEFPDDGEEYLERKWMEEQRQFEIDSDELGEVDINQKTNGKDVSGEERALPDEGGAATCPICSASFVGFTNQVR